jgi:hypothetical protein
VNWKGWLFSVGLLLLTAYLAFKGGLFMHGD